jgi:hypothetical protein
LWCGGYHLHKDCPEKENPSSTPKCCNCQLAEGGTHILPTIGAVGMQKKKYEKGSPEKQPISRLDGSFLQTLLPPQHPSQRLFEATQSVRIGLIYTRIQ